MRDERGELITMSEALKSLPCTRAHACGLLRERLDPATGLSLGGRLEGRQLSPRCWLVYRHSVEAAATTFRWDAGTPKGTKRPGGTLRQRRRRRAS